jgi:ankyrin repeat protein
MAANDTAESNAATARHSGAGPINTTSGSGRQVNNTISGGSGNTQYHAANQYFHGTQVPDQDQLDADFRKTLFLTSPEIDRKNLVDVKGEVVTATCDWILRTDEYEEWARKSTHELLWIWGGPGKGKTMLSISISQELEKNNKTIYYFCSAARENCNTAIMVIRGLLWHLTAIYPKLAGALRTKLGSAVEEALLSRETLWAAFLELIGKTGPEPLYCVVDGLDECDESSQQWLARKFASLRGNAAADKLKLVVVSRYTLELRDVIQVKLDSEYSREVSSSVDVLVEVKMKELISRFPFNDKLHEDIKQRLSAGAHGSFLWIGFAMTELLKQTKIKGVLSSLKVLPRDLYKLYDRMLGAINSNQRDTALRILGWVSSACRPMTPREVAAIRDHAPPSDSLNTDDSVQDLIATCEPLLRMSSGNISLVHESVRGYVNEANFSDGLRMEREEVHLQLAQACIDALAKSSALSSYAEAFWPYHARQSGSRVHFLIAHRSSFFDTKSTVRARWWQAYCASQPLPSLNHVSIPRLHMACCLGIEPWVKSILELGGTWSPRSNPCNEIDSRGYTPLLYAAHEGHEKVVGLLLRWGADAHIKDGRLDMTAPTIAAERGHVATLRVLLDHGTSPNTSHGQEDGTLLHYAVRGDHVEMVRLLLDRGACAHFHAQPGLKTLLHLAVISGHDTIVQLLLTYGADVDVADIIAARFGDPTMLLVAARLGHEATMKLLLEHGASVNALDEIGYSALHHTISRGTVGAVKLLLKYGAETLFKTNGNATAQYLLNLAERRGGDEGTTLINILRRHEEKNGRTYPSVEYEAADHYATNSMVETTTVHHDAATPSVKARDKKIKTKDNAWPRPKKLLVPITPSFEGFVFTVLDPLRPGETVGWFRSRKVQMSLSSQELYDKAVAHQKKTGLGIIGMFQTLGRNQQTLVNRLVEEKNAAEKDPDAQWLLFGIKKLYEERRSTFKTWRINNAMRITLRRGAQKPVDESTLWSMVDLRDLRVVNDSPAQREDDDRTVGVDQDYSGTYLTSSEMTPSPDSTDSEDD